MTATGPRAGPAPRRAPSRRALALAALLSSACGTAGPAPIRVGSKNFTEQVILGEIVAALLERRAGATVDRRLDLGGTFVCHKALAAGELDVYVEYSGTALAAILEEPPGAGPAAVLERVRGAYRQRFDLEWLAPLGFDNTFAIVVRADDARRLGLARISDLAKAAGALRAGFGYEFLERADGWRGLAAAYGLTLREPPREMDLGLIYRALAEGEVDVVAGSATDGLIEPMGLVVLEDDRRYFPPYDAVPVARAPVLRRRPEVREALEALGGRITVERMRGMNHAVDGGRRAPHDVALEFLQAEGLVSR